MKSYTCCLGHGDAKEGPLYTHNGTKVLIRHLHNNSTKHSGAMIPRRTVGLARGFDQTRAQFHDAQYWELVLAASSRSAQAKSQHAEALV